MARGALKSDLKSNSIKEGVMSTYKPGKTVAELLQAEVDAPTSAEEAKKILNAAESRFALPDPTEKTARAISHLIENQAALKPLMDLMVKVGIHHGGSSKDLKVQIIKYFDRLPKEVQDAITEPKDFISKLYRGGSHPSNPLEEGGLVNTGFSTLIGVARAWTYNGTNRYGMKQSGIYTANEIESFDKIISLPKLWVLAREYNNHWKGQRPPEGWTALPDKLYDESDEPHGHYQSSTSYGKPIELTKFFGGQSTSGISFYQSEREHIVTGIKWAPNAGRDARRNRLRFDKKYPNQPSHSTVLSIENLVWMPY